MNFKEAANDLETLEQEFVKLCDDLSQVAIENAKIKTKCRACWIRVNRRIKQLQMMPGKLARDAGLSAERILWN